MTALARTRAPDPGHVWRIVRVEFVRTWRQLSGSVKGALTILALVVGIPMYSLIGGVGTAAFGDSLTADAGAVALFGAMISGATVVLTSAVARHVLSDGVDPAAGDGLLTTVPAIEVLAGLVCTELGYVFVVVSLPVAALTGGLVVATNAPLAGLVLFCLALWTVAVAAVTGYALAFVVALATHRSARIKRIRNVLGALLGVGIFVAYMASFQVDGLADGLSTVAVRTPLSWPGHLVAVVLPGPTGALGPALAVIGALVVASVVAPLATAALAGRVWFGDRARGTGRDSGTVATLLGRVGSVLTRPLRAVLARPTYAVIVKSWRRTRRSPLTVQYALFPFFVLALYAESLLAGRVPPELPVLIAVVSGLAGGSAFSLNPLGGERAVLPAVLTSGIAGRSFITGLALAGAIPAALLATTLAVALGALADLSVARVLLAAATGVVVAVTAPFVAAGLGVVFPEFETKTVRSREVVVPSGWANGGYLAVLVPVVVPAILAQWPAVGHWLPAAAPFTASFLALGGFGTTALLATLAAVIGGVGAAVRFDGYRLD